MDTKGCIPFRRHETKPQNERQKLMGKPDRENVE
jgi:hypothetical protein